MIYSFSLSQVAVWLGFGSFLIHAWSFFDYDRARAWWRAFPRSEPMGGFLLALATAWAAWLAGTMNLMEYTRFRPLFILAAVALGVTSWLYVREFIAVRALGVLLLLGANILLDACFLREDHLRLLVVAYAYVMIVKGMFMVGAPYLMRDGIDWAMANPFRGKLLVLLGLLFALVLLGLGVFVY
ncbi:MAG: hypothetical protein EBZ44_02165 [Verrucomicrobia bacterium]|nr:hypothetical protein [bacterium]NDA09652.1 hypothetical protein [Verrucomicrobiota bacterium]NDA25478.1 hypothetical protein [Verrucomicrobiota bacterium]NDD56518.1 hypothetical protein [Verrucomicrobiota bacterium]NDD81271.1 hypothetical protein [Verrucomicrobiota bacterium]